MNTVEDLKGIIKPEYLLILEDLHILEKVLNIIEEQHITLEQFEKATSKAKNFADFMRKAFIWNNTNEKFSWWFEKVFGEEFPRLPIPNDRLIVNHYVYTSMILDEYINIYKR